MACIIFAMRIPHTSKRVLWLPQIQEGEAVIYKPSIARYVLIIAHIISICKRQGLADL